MRSTAELRAVRVLGGRKGTKRIGKILRGVLSPDASAFLGYIVARPDFLFMFKRRHRFLASDSFRVVDGRVVATIDRDSWDESACKRLGVNWDFCLIVEGMTLVTKGGEKVGTVDSVTYDERTGKVDSLQVGDGLASKAILGVSSIPLDLIVGYQDGQIIAKPAASTIQAEGGLATKAGEQVAVVSHVVKGKTASARKTVKKISKKTGAAADQALDVGSKALGKQLGKTKGMFKAFADEYKKESK